MEKPEKEDQKLITSRDLLIAAITSAFAVISSALGTFLGQLLINLFL